FRGANAQQRAGRLTDRQSGARPQIKKASQKLRIGRSEKQLRERGGSAKQHGRRQSEGNAGPKRAVCRCAVGHESHSTRGEIRSTAKIFAIPKINCPRAAAHAIFFSSGLLQPQSEKRSRLTRSARRLRPRYGNNRRTCWFG